MKRLLLAALLALPALAFAQYQGTWTIDGSGNITSMSSTPDWGTNGDFWFLSPTITNTGNWNAVAPCFGGLSGTGAFGTFVGENVFSNGGLNTYGGGGTVDCRSPGNYYLIFTHGTAADVSSYYELYYDGTTSTPVNPAESDTSTHFTVVAPLNGDTVATNTPFTLTGDGVINTKDIPTPVPNSTVSVLWSYERITNKCIDVICALNSSGTFQFRQSISINTTSTQTFIAGTTSPGVSGTGIWIMKVSLQVPTSILGFNSFFGLFNFGYNTLTSTTTQFTIGTSTALDQVLSGVASQTFTSTTTQAALDACLPIPGTWNMNDCVVGLFVPPQAPNFASQFGGLANKPPFGYFTQISLILQNGSSTDASTTAGTLPLAGGGANALMLFSPVLGELATVYQYVRDGIVLVIWLMVLLYAYHRVSRFDFQA